MSDSETSAVAVSQDLVLVPTSAFLLGFVSGLVSASKLSGRQFLAENAHRLPTTVQGWYFYQKTKNYRVMYGGIKGGLRTGSQLGGWTLAFVGLQEGLERTRRTMASELHPDVPSRWLSGATSGLALAGAAGVIYRLPRAGGAKRLLLGASLGLVAGSCQDARNWLRTKLPAPTAVAEEAYA